MNLVQAAMKIPLQLSIDPELKQRLEKLKQKSHIPMAALIDIMLRDHLPEYEVKYGSSPLPDPPRK